MHYPTDRIAHTTAFVTPYSEKLTVGGNTLTDVLPQDLISDDSIKIVFNKNVKINKLYKYIFFII